MFSLGGKKPEPMSIYDKSSPPLYRNDSKKGNKANESENPQASRIVSHILNEEVFVDSTSSDYTS